MDLEAYFERIDYHGAVTPVLDTLRRLHRQHMLTVPFENLDIHLGRPIVLDQASFFEKIIRERRGGFCYELNGLFAELLREIGFQITLLSARVAHEDGSFGQEFDHLVLLVLIDGGEWIADVGFGDSFLEPLRLRGGEQEQGGWRYMIDDPQGKFLLLRYEQSKWRQKYLFTTQPRRLEEFAGMCAYHQTSPRSSFPRSRLCTRAIEEGRITLAELRMIETGAGGRQEKELASEADYRAALKEHFGIELRTPVWKKPVLSGAA